MDLFFECSIERNGTLCAADDVERLQWIDIKELDSNRFGLRSIRTGVERLKTAITDNEK
jgi:hypothetical protein